MQFVIVAVLMGVLLGPASAQGIQSPSQVAIQIDNIINQWAQVLEVQQKQIEDLKKENADLKAKAAPAPKSSDDAGK